MEKKYEYDYDQYDCVIKITGAVNYKLHKELLPFNSTALEDCIILFHKEGNYGDTYDKGFRWGIELAYDKYKKGEPDEILRKYGYTLY
jgi:hypothetical protein